MAKHNDDDPVMFWYSSDVNLTMDNTDDPSDSGYTWGEWRKMTGKQKQEALEEYLWTVIDVGVHDEDD